MFVVSLSSKKIKKLYVIVSCVVVFVATAVILSQCLNGFDVLSAEATGTKVVSESSLMTFISNYGWEVDDEPDEVREVIIPAEFDDVYNNYNEIQLKQGYDLKAFAGERVKRWTYTVKNYPGYVGEECIKINILVFNGKVIGGDVCSVELDGFMHGFAN